MFDLFSFDWWTAAMFGWFTPVVWVLAAVAAAWLRYDATVWGDALDVVRMRIGIREFISRGASCDLCSTYWVTSPALVAFGPVLWLGVNGGYLLLATWAPTLSPPDDDNDDDDDQDGAKFTVSSPYFPSPSSIGKGVA